MAKRKKTKLAEGLVRIPISFPDSRLVRLMDAAAKAQAEEGMPGNRSKFVREAVREKLKRQGINA